MNLNDDEIFEAYLNSQQTQLNEGPVDWVKDKASAAWRGMPGSGREEAGATATAAAGTGAGAVAGAVPAAATAAQVAGAALASPVIGAAGVGGVAGAVGQIGAGAHNRAKIKAMEFATGRGGAISQLVGKVGGALFGANMDKLKAQHSMAEGTQHLWGRIQGLLKLHPEGLTGKMYKDFIAQQPVKPGGPKVNITKLPSTSKLKDDEVYTADRIKDVLIPNTISELYESGQTGQTAEITTEAIERLIIGGLASGKDIGEMIAHLDTGGFIPPP